MKKNKDKKFRLVVSVLFICYLLALCYFLFFAENLGRTGSSGFHYNFQPFKEISRYIVYRKQIGFWSVTLNLLGNIVAFLPMGVFFPLIFDSKMKGFSTILISFEISVLVELIQLLSKVGSCDVDDVILNTLGSIIGCILYYIVKKIRSTGHGSKKTKKIR